jgi:hypothetical protein
MSTHYLIQAVTDDGCYTAYFPLFTVDSNESYVKGICDALMFLKNEDQISTLTERLTGFGVSNEVIEDFITDGFYFSYVAIAHLAQIKETN